ncbi:MAG: sulfur carrier protein ThiS [Deltaproteobacteria bacterium]|nr:sulfur carrier protein ThiS [Deltaproteobacteria bacterium]
MIRVNGKEHGWRKKMTIADLVKELEGGSIYSVVRVNEQYISKPDFEKSHIPDDAEIYLIPMITGG